MTTTPALNDDLVRLTERHTECIEAIRHIADTLGREGDHDSRVCIKQLSDEFERLFAAALEALSKEIEALRQEAGELVVAQYAISAREARIADLEALIAAQHGDVVVRTAHLLYEKDDKIEALRAALNEPTDAMLEAGEEEITQRRQFGARIYASDIWHAMARTALKGA